MKLRMHTDGAARGNPGKAAIGVYIINDNGTILEEYGRKIEDTTNNVAEYKALIKGLKLASKYVPDVIHCYVDSELLANQLNGHYKVKAEHLRPLFEEVNSLASGFKDIHFRHIRRTNGYQKIADALANKALDS